MKSFVRFLVLLLCVIVLTVFSCEKKEEIKDSPVQFSEDLKLNMEEEGAYYEKYASLPGPTRDLVSTRSAVTYQRSICDDYTVVGSALKNAWWNGGVNYRHDNGDYYCFDGNAGDYVTIRVFRINKDGDPIAQLRYGTITDGSEWTTGLLGTSDDIADDCNTYYSGCYSDPYIQITLPYTGTYSLGVWDYFSCGTCDEYSYGIQTSGIACQDDPFCGVPVNANYDPGDCISSCDLDSDGDGFNDDLDNHPYSNQEATVIIDGCDSGVDNVHIEFGSNMSDLIGDCAAAATNHGQFVSCVSALTNAWKSAGLISGAQKAAIQSCAAQSSIP